jgi:hypothetical protein
MPFVFASKNLKLWLTFVAPTKGEGNIVEYHVEHNITQH